MIKTDVNSISRSFKTSNASAKSCLHRPGVSSRLGVIDDIETSSNHIGNVPLMIIYEHKNGVT